MTEGAVYPDGATVERDPRPIVGVPRRGTPAALIAAIGLIAAILLFVTLDAQRRRAQFVAVERQPVVYSPPPPLTIPTEPVPRPQAIPVVAAQPVAIVAAPVAVPPPPPPVERQEPPPQYFQPPPPQVREIPRPLPSRPSSSTAAALVIDSGGGDLAIGTLIPAVLETPIDTSRPGLVRAIVSQDARGEDGQKVLVPRGSRLIGEYQSDVRSGQNRVLVNWTRLVRPDGAAVRIGVPSADSTGAAGIPGRYHSFFLSRFFNAALQTALTVGASSIGGNNGNNTVIVGLPNSVSTASQGLMGEPKRPKITVKAGTLFNVFVNREIDFSGATPPQ